MTKTLENNWSRAVLLNFLDTSLFEREGKAISNFNKALPEETFGIKIIREYMKKTQINDMKKILQTPLEEIYRFYKNNTRSKIYVRQLYVYEEDVK